MHSSPSCVGPFQLMIQPRNINSAATLQSTDWPTSSPRTAVGLSACLPVPTRPSLLSPSAQARRATWKGERTRTDKEVHLWTETTRSYYAIVRGFFDLWKTPFSTRFDLGKALKAKSNSPAKSYFSCDFLALFANDESHANIK